MSDIDSSNAPATSDFSRAAIEAIVDPIARLRVLMKRLLDPGGCPWDREQTHTTLRQYLIEEAYEAAEAITDGDDALLCEELGDVGLQVIFHAELAERAGRFRVEDVYDHICAKLISRHPHVFGDVVAEDSGAVLKNWEQLKKEEKRRKAEAAGAEGPVSALAGVPRALPALQRAGRLQEKASRVGFDWERAEDVALKVREEVEEFLAEAGLDKEKTKNSDQNAMQEEFGDLLFSLVNLSRFLNIRAEDALEAANKKFIRRFSAVEKAAEAQNKHLKDMTLSEMDALWNEIKRGEAQ